MQAVIDQYELPESPGQLARKVSTSAVTGSAEIDVTASDPDAERAAFLANGVAQELVESRPMSRGSDLPSVVDRYILDVQSDIERSQARRQELLALPFLTPELRAELDEIENRVTSLRDTYASLAPFASTVGGTDTLVSLDPAVVPTAPSGTPPVYPGLLAAVAGLLLAAGLAFVVEYAKDSLRTQRDVEEAIGLPVLGTVEERKDDVRRGESSRLVALDYHDSPEAELYRSVRARIHLLSDAEPIRAILVTAVPGCDGKTSTAANLAVAFAQAGRRVTLVDADLYRPTLHFYFGLSNERGLSTLVTRPGTGIDDVMQPTMQVNLMLVAAGPPTPDPSGVLSSYQMRGYLEGLRETSDLLLVNGPMTSRSADATILASYLKQTVMVIRARGATARDVREARRSLAVANGDVIGIVLHRLIRGGRRTGNTSASGTQASRAELPSAVERPS
jgi:non-specific protein-tyrosine kinase